uniref:Uncharacterized protein n=1 Tax=Calidris pygmaea TaxID=425635 RepID=A0A8C3JWQ9_9CHAR
MIRGVKHLSYKERLRDLSLFTGVPPRLTHAIGQIEENVVSAQASQEVEEASDGGSAGAAALPVLQQGGGGVGLPLQPPDLQVLAAQLLRQRRPVGGRRRPRVEVEAEAAPHAVVERYQGHGVEVGGRGAGLGSRRRRLHGRAAPVTSRSAALSLPASPRPRALPAPAPAPGGDPGSSRRRGTPCHGTVRVGRDLLETVCSPTHPPPRQSRITQGCIQAGRQDLGQAGDV